MRRFLGCLSLVLCLLHTGSADAARSMTIDVPRTGGAYTIKVNPRILTVFHFPGEVTIAYCLQDSAVVMERHHSSVTLRPLKGTRFANAIIETKLFRVGVLFEVVEDPEEATMQVEFRDLDIEALFESRVQLEVAQRMQPHEREIERQETALRGKEANLDQIVRQTKAETVAEGLLMRHEEITGGHGARNQTTVLRLHRVLWIGRDAYLFVSIQNQARTRYDVGALEVRGGGGVLSLAVAFSARPPPEEAGLVGWVMPKSREQGVIVMSDAEAWIGKNVTLALVAGLDHHDDLSLTFVLPQ